MKARVLVGESVFEDATLTIFDEMLHVEFDAEDLDAVAIPVAALSELQATPDSSKDLEKDEAGARDQSFNVWREQREQRGFPLSHHHSVAYDAGWRAAKAHFGARLQQVEAERDALIRTGEKTEQYLGGKLQAAEDRDCRLADELSIAREALATTSVDRDMALSALTELVRLKTHPEHDQMVAEKQAAWSRAQDVVVRLQAKEDEPIAEQMEK